MKRALFLVGLFAALLLYPAFPVFAADGFGQSTTGGAGGNTVTVTTATDLATYVGIIDTPYIIQVSGVIDLNSLTDKKISIRSNKTIKGIGENPTIIGSLAFKNGSSNVIIERLNITAPTSSYGEGDGISVKEDINNVFITKCTLYNCWDGCIDITRRSDWVTVSWCKFYFSSMNSNNDRVHLVGAGDTHDDQGKLHITFHHNWYGTFCWQRIPSVRFGRAHVYNNYYNCSGDLYCVRTRLYAECLVENNYFKDVQNPWERYVSSVGVDHPGLLYAAGNALVNVTWNVHESGVVLIDGNDTVFTPPYSYTLDDANDIPAMVQSGAGADGNDFFPHWLFGPYGDFNRNDVVDTNDLKQFAENYWLVNDEEQIADADYNGDGIVNFYEFALLAENWLKEEE
jgi:pectate lyase